MKILTISIAAYNSQEYIKRTLESLIKCDYLDKLEIFVIDDGGQDATLKIASDYSKRYPSIIPVHKENGGYGTTVNWSVEHASGKYFKLLDGDDYFDTEGLNELVRAMESSEADAFLTKIIVNKNGKCSEEYTFCQKYDGKLVEANQLAEEYPAAMWGYAFKTEIVREHHRALPSHMLYTDQIYVTHSLEGVRTIQVLNKPVYVWVLGRAEQSNSNASLKKHYKDLIISCDIINKDYKEFEKNTGTHHEYLFRRVTQYYVTSFVTICRIEHSREIRNAIVRWDRTLKKEYPSIYKKSGSVKHIKLLRATSYVAYWFLYHNNPAGS